jgi:hypothetical protein
MPTATGSSAAPSADNGATTLIGPAASPAKNTITPTPLTAPAANPHPSLPAATGPPVASAAASMITAPTGALAARNDSADARRDPTPPRKSAEPHRTAAANASTAAMALLRSLC